MKKKLFTKSGSPCLLTASFQRYNIHPYPRKSPLPDRTHKLKTPQCMHFKLIHSKTPYSNKWYLFHVLKSPSKPPHLPPHSSPKHVQEFLSSIAMQTTSKLSASPSHLLCWKLQHLAHNKSSNAGILQNPLWLNITTKNKWASCLQAHLQVHKAQSTDRGSDNFAAVHSLLQKKLKPCRVYCTAYLIFMLHQKVRDLLFSSSEHPMYRTLRSSQG